MQVLLEQLFNGLGLAGPTLLIAVALSTSYAATHGLNIAVGAIYVVGAMLGTWAARHHGAAGFLAAVILTPVVAVVALEVLVLRWQRERAADAEMGSFAATLGVSLVLGAVAMHFSGGQPLALPADFMRFGEFAHIGGVALDLFALMIFAIAVAVAVGWAIVLRRTRSGKLYRAVAADRVLARSIGTRIEVICVHSAAVSGLLLAAATCLFLLRTRSVGTESASGFLLVPFAAVLAGGLGSIRGAAIAALFFGVATSVVSAITSTPGVQDVVVFGLLFAVLMLRPRGIVVQQTGERAF